MSWLKPACDVNRSALAVSSATEFAPGATVNAKGVAEVESMSAHVVPSLLARVSWFRSTAVLTGPAPAGTNLTDRPVGEKLPLPDGHGPAPAQIVAPAAFLFAFHRSLT